MNQMLILAFNDKDVKNIIKEFLELKGILHDQTLKFLTNSSKVELSKNKIEKKSKNKLDINLYTKFQKANEILKVVNMNERTNVNPYYNVNENYLKDSTTFLNTV